MNKDTAIQIILESKLPSLDNRGALCELMHRYSDCINQYATGELTKDKYDYYQITNQVDMYNLLKLDGIGPKTTKAIIVLLESGNSRFVSDGLDYEPDQLGEDD